MEKRTLGNTGEELSIIGFGGIIVTDESTESAANHVAEAIDLGVNYFDVAPSYGNAEEMLGPALKPYRNNNFLACKTGKRDAKGAEEELHNSLKLLHTDYFDLYQFHAVASMEDVEKITAPGGALETVIKAKEKGIIKHVGFSAHDIEAATSLIDQYDFDSVLYPINVPCWHHGNFGKQLMEKAKSKGMAVLALKTMCRRPLEEGEKPKWTKCWYNAIDTLEEAIPALSFTLSKPITAAIPPGHMELFRIACQAIDQRVEVTEDKELELATANPNKALFSCPYS